LDIIVDHVGVDTLPKGVWALAKGGRIVTCGVTSGGKMEINFAPVFFKSLSILGSTMGGLGEMKQVSELVFAQKLCPIVANRFNFEQISEAHSRLDSRKSFGKLLLQINYN
jgi:NADPH2:quinone reductase